MVSLSTHTRRHAFALAASATALTAIPFTALARGETIARVKQGNLRGCRDGGVHVFKGIPYGADTSGARRFIRPEPAPPWSGVRDATSYGPACPQINVPAGYPTMMAPGRESFQTFLGWGMDDRQSEDCLVLNVWTSGLRDGGRRPVMVRLHGGGFSAGSGSWPQSDGTRMARNENLVMVTINHRLGALGYLYLAELAGPRYADSGNAGMLDLILALKWVRENIEEFGGDPQNVTIFGESGGGFKVSTILAMPEAQGLFHKAIIESGPGLTARAPDQATSDARTMLAGLKVTPGEIGRLHELPFQSFAKPDAMVQRPVLDGRNLLQNPGDAMKAGASKNVPVLIGTNLTENTLLTLVSELPQVASLDEEGMRARIAKLVKPDADVDAVVSAYRKASPGATPGQIFLLADSDRAFRARSVELAELKGAGGNAPVYMYLLTWRTPADGGLYGVPHGLEVPLTMDNVDTSTALSKYPESRILAARMSGAWAAFARTGNPNIAKLPNWLPYNPATRATMLFDNDPKVVSDPYNARSVWRSFTAR